MDPRAIIGGAVALVVAAMVITTVTWEIEVEETRYTNEPYTYEQELVREKQVSKIPWFWIKITQVQYLIKNTDVREGTFTLSCLFDNGIDSEVKTKKVKLLPSEVESVTINSSLSGVSKVSLNVAPPNKSVSQQITVKKTVNAWYYLPFLRFLFK